METGTNTLTRATVGTTAAGLRPTRAVSILNLLLINLLNLLILGLIILA